jgi:hypothetical protein
VGILQFGVIRVDFGNVAKFVAHSLPVRLLQSGALFAGNAIAKLLDDCVSILGHIGGKIESLRVYNKRIYLDTSQLIEMPDVQKKL